MKNKTSKRVVAGFYMLLSLCLIICGLVAESYSIYCRDVFFDCTEGACTNNELVSWGFCVIWCLPPNEFTRMTCIVPDGR